MRDAEDSSESMGFQRPEIIAQFVLCLAYVEASCGLPIMLGRLASMLFFERTFEPVVLVFRVFAIIIGLAAVVVTSLTYQDLRALPCSIVDTGSEEGIAIRWHLTEMQLGRLRQGGRRAVSAGMLVTALHVADICLNPAGGFVGGPFGQALLLSSCLTLACHMAVVAVTFLAYVWHWQPFGPPSDGLTEVGLPNLRSSVYSSVVEKSSVEFCCLCLCYSEEGEVVSTLPCGHVFHRNCLDLWLRQGCVCPLRCRANSGMRVALPPGLRCNDIQCDSADTEAVSV